MYSHLTLLHTFPSQFHWLHLQPAQEEEKIFRHKFCIEWNILKHSVHTDTSSQPSASHFPKRVPMMYFQSISQTQFQNSAHCCYIQLLIFHHNTVYCNPIHVLLHNATFHWKSVCQQRQTGQRPFGHCFKTYNSTST